MIAATRPPTTRTPLGRRPVVWDYSCPMCRAHRTPDGWPIPCEACRDRYDADARDYERWTDSDLDPEDDR